MTSEKNEEKAPLIFQRMAEVMKKVGPISKNRKNTGQGYNFRGVDDVYNELQSILAENEVFTIPEVLADRSEERTTKSGSTTIYRILKMKYTFYTVDGSSVSAIVIGEGMDSGDKASNKAMSVAHKYCFLQVFSIPTEDSKDPENHDHELLPRFIHINAKSLPSNPKPVASFTPPAEVSIAGGNLAEYVAPYGNAKIKGKMLGQVSADVVREAISYWKSIDKKDPLSPKMKEFVATLEAYLSSLSKSQQAKDTVMAGPGYDFGPPGYDDAPPYEDIPY